MPLGENLIEVREHSGAGYNPLVDYERWRVALLNFSPDLSSGRLAAMQRHDETDEVFVLLRGRCVLFIGEGDQTIDGIHAVPLQPLKIYNVKKAVWHTHALSPDAMVLIVENRDTTYGNSPFCPLSETQRREIIASAGGL